MTNKDIDQKIGMPDIDKEWAKFEREVIDAPYSITPRSSAWKSRAAAIVLICTVGVAALASTFFLINRSQEDAAVSFQPAVMEIAQVQAETDTTNVLGTYLDEQQQKLVFDNVEMEHIALCLKQYYGIETQFANEESKHIRLYVTLNCAKPIDEIVAYLNNLQVVQLRLEDNHLTIQ